MLYVRVFAVADKTAACQTRIRHFKIQFVVRIDFLFHIQMIAVRVVTFVCYAFNNAELFGIQTAETIAQIFARGGIQTERITGFCAPLFGGFAQIVDDFDPFAA